mmetsp:Transcript_15434/g.31885  ORF Transcript_15434/g.31885 Transcript_15434/m.31885 type:complete len:383 (-) Transcript_15434:34-1182(-)
MASVGCNGDGSTSASTAMFGADGEETSSSEHQKGIGRERSFQPESNWTQLNTRLEGIARLVAEDMTRKSIVGHTVTVKVKLETFDALSRSQSQKRGVYVQNPEELLTIAGGLFAAMRAAYLNKESKNTSKKKFSVRLLGIRCSNLIEESSFQARKHEGTIERFLSSSSSSPSVGDGGIFQCHTSNLGSTKSATIEEDDKIVHATTNRTLFIKRQYMKQMDGAVPALCNSKKRQDRDAISSTDCILSHPKEGRETSSRLFVPVNKKDEIDSNIRSPAVPVTSNEGKHQLIHHGNHTTNDAEEERESEEEGGVVSCPLCSRSFLAKDNDRLNAHIDICLNGVHGTSTVRKAIQEEDSRLQHVQSLAVDTGVYQRKRQRLTDFWS